MYAIKVTIDVIDGMKAMNLVTISYLDLQIIILCQTKYCTHTFMTVREVQMLQHCNSRRLNVQYGTMQLMWEKRKENMKINFEPSG